MSYSSWEAKSQTRLSDKHFTFYFFYTFVVLLYFYKIFIKIQVDNVKVLGESEYTDNDIMPVAISSVQFSR